MAQRNGSATEDATVEELISQVSGDSELSRSPKQKLLEERVKHRAIRPSARLTALTADANGVPVAADGAGLRQVRGGLTGGLKKYTKNSRRPRGRYGRGLPKKGEQGTALVVLALPVMREPCVRVFVCACMSVCAVAQVCSSCADVAV